MAKLKVAVISKDKIEYEGEASALFVPTQTGIIEVLPNHTQLISALKAGEIIVITDTSLSSQDPKNPSSDLRTGMKFKVSGGVLEVRPGSNVVILADLIKE